MEKFERVRVVGRGAYGVCWLCRRRDDVLGEKVILKTIPLHGLSEEEERAIMGEVKVLQKMQHPAVIGYYDYFKFDNDNQLAIVMQYAEGGTLEKLIHDQKGKNEFIKEERVLAYFVQILLALDHMHSKQIVHRDLKTQNILLNRKKTLVKLSDFGISKELTTKSVASTVIGTPNYLSPEICEGRQYNYRSDLWSLGCVLYEMLELRRTFDGENLPSIVMKITQGRYKALGDHVSKQMKDIVTNLLCLNEKARPEIKQILTAPLVLPHTLSNLLDVGRVDYSSGLSEKRRPSQSYHWTTRLRTTPATMVTTPGTKSPVATPPRPSSTVFRSDSLK